MIEVDPDDKPKNQTTQQLALLKKCRNLISLIAPVRSAFDFCLHREMLTAGMVDRAPSYIVGDATSTHKNLLVMQQAYQTMIETQTFSATHEKVKQDEAFVEKANVLLKAFEGMLEIAKSYSAE